MKALWTIFFIVMIAVNADGVRGEEKGKVFASYSLSDSNDSAHLLKEVKTGEELLPGHYSVKAKLSFKTEKMNVVFKSLYFELAENSRSLKKILQRGWTAYDKTYLWHPSNEENVLTVPLSLKSTDKDTSITDFNEIHIDYQDLFLENPSNLSVQMLVSGKMLGKTAIILAGTTGERQLTPVKKLDIAPTTWREKDYSYLAKRELGLPFDDTWRYSSSGSNTVFQRRFHLNIDSFETIDLVMQPGATKKQIEPLVCNFRIGFKDALKSNDILAWDSVPKKTLRIKGQKVVRVGLGEYIRKKYGRSNRIYLKEMIFFLPGNTSQVLRTPVLKTINFLAPVKFDIPVEVLDVNAFEWKPKDISDLANQIVKHPIDTTWWYSVDGPNMLIHKRFNKDLSLLEAIDFVFSTKIDVTTVRMDLRIGSKTVEWKELPKRVLKVRGKSVLRIQIGELLRNKYAKKEKIFLEEAVISVPKKAALVAQDQLVKKLVFRSFLGVDSVLPLSSRIEDLSRNKKRLVMDIRELQDKLGWNAKIHRMTLTVRPQYPESTAALELQSARAINLWEEEQPVFLDTGNKLLSRWGGPFLDLGDENQNVEWPRVHAFLPFHRGEESLQGVFGKKRNNDIRVQSANKTPGRLKNLSTDENIGEPTDKIVDSLVRFRGATIRAHPILSSWSSEPRGLTLEGKEGGWIEIFWPVQADIETNSKLFLGITEGAEAIQSIQATLLFRGQQLKQVFGLPNHPFHIDSSIHKIDGIKTRIMLRKNHFKLKLDEMALFQPVAVTPAQALDIPIPLKGNTLLIPKDVLSPPGTQVSINQGNLSAIIFPEINTPKTLTWTTDINRKVDGIQSVKINYQAPSTIANHPCWLELTLVGPEHEAQKTVCPKLSSGQIVIPANDLFYDSEIPSDEVIKFITWKVNFGDTTDSKQPLVLGMAVTLEGTKFLSLKQDLIQHSVLEWQDQKIFPASLADSSAIDLLSGRKMVNLGNLSIKNAFGKNLNLKFSDHPHLDVQTVVFEKLESITPEIWASLLEADQNNTSPSMSWLSKLFRPLMVLALLWWGWKRAWHTHLWKGGKKWSFLFWVRIKSLFQRFPRTISEKGFLFNRVVGFTILGPGLFATGWLFEGGKGKFILGAIIVLFIGVLWHELRWWFLAPHKADDLKNFSNAKQRSKNGSLVKDWIFGANKDIPPFLYLVAAMGLSWLTFKSGYGYDLIPSLLPILGVTYFYIPWLPWFFKGKIRFWTTTATGLYLLGILGLLLKWRTGADYFFSFAGIAVVVIWRNLQPKIRLKLEQRWPSLVDKVYGGEGTPYIAGFILTLAITAFFLIVQLKPIAEQIAVVGYFMLVVGVYLEAKALRKESRERKGKDEMTTTGESTSRA